MIVYKKKGVHCLQLENIPKGKWHYPNCHKFNYGKRKKNKNSCSLYENYIFWKASLGYFYSTIYIRDQAVADSETLNMFFTFLLLIVFNAYIYIYIYVYIALFGASFLDIKYGRVWN